MSFGKQKTNLFIHSILLFLGWVYTAVAYAMPKMNMPFGVTEVAHHIYDLHMFVFYICAVFCLIIYAVMIYCMYQHRRSRGAKAAHFHENLTVEIIWTVIPLIIVIIMAIPTVIVLNEASDSSNAAMNIKITGYQWKWKYEYLDDNLSFYSNLSTPQAQIHNQEPKNEWYLLEVDNPLVLPTNTKVRLLITSNDVNHSWWVPDFGVKEDAISGFIHEAWVNIEEPGTYRGQCTELCGMQHGYMPVVVVAKTPEDYQKWLLEQHHGVDNPAPVENTSKNFEQQMTMGKKVYEQLCSACHKDDGQGQPPVFPRLIGSKVTTGPVEDHIDIVLHGRSGTAMQPFDDKLSDDAIAAVVTYQRNAWGNADQSYGPEAGGLVQGDDVKALRD